MIGLAVLFTFVALGVATLALVLLAPPRRFESGMQARAASWLKISSHGRPHPAWRKALKGERVPLANLPIAGAWERVVTSAVSAYHPGEPFWVGYDALVLSSGPVGQAYLRGELRRATRLAARKLYRGTVQWEPLWYYIIHAAREGPARLYQQALRTAIRELGA